MKKESELVGIRAQAEPQASVKKPSSYDAPTAKNVVNVEHSNKKHY